MDGCFDRGPRALATETAKRREIRCGEFGVLHEIAEEFGVPDEREFVIVVLGCGNHDTVLALINHVDRLAVLVRSFGVARPRGHNGGR